MMVALWIVAFLCSVYCLNLILCVVFVLQKDVGLYQMLGNYMKRETVEKVECKSCGPHSKFSKKLTIGRVGGREFSANV